MRSLLGRISFFLVVVIDVQLSPSCWKSIASNTNKYALTDNFKLPTGYTKLKTQELDNSTLISLNDQSLLDGCFFNLDHNMCLLTPSIKLAVM